jgi:hypothetical protein
VGERSESTAVPYSLRDLVGERSGSTAVPYSLRDHVSSESWSGSDRPCPRDVDDVPDATDPSSRD